MSDANANISISIDTSAALSQLKALQRQISLFHTSVAKSTTTAARAQQDLQKSLIDDINATGKFAASLTKIKTSTETFTDSLERNKFSMREYFRYAGASTKTFGRMFKSEFDTISKVAEERVKTLQTQYIKLGRDANGALQSIAVRPLALNMQDYGTKTALAAQKQALFNQLMKQGSTNLLNFGKNTQWAGRQLMVGFTIPLTLLGSTASKVFMDMEAQALKFKKVYGDLFTPAAETQRALDDIRELGRVFTRYGVAVSETMGLAAEAAAAGFQGTDLMRQTREATRLSVLGEIDRQQALKTTIALQNAFGLSSDELASKINFLNAVENQTVTSLNDITEAIPRVAPVIQQLGGNVEDLAYFITAMKEGGINAAEGANALKSGLSAIINPTGRAAAMFEKLNININDIVLKNKGNLKATIQSFATALDDLDPLNRAQALEQLFGRFQLARVSALFANIAKDGSQASRVLGIASTSMEDLAATADSELGLIEQSASTKFKAAIESLKVSIAPVGEEFLKAVTPIVEFFGNIADKFNNLSDRSKRIITIIVGLVGAIGPVFLMTFGLLANGIANIIKLFLTLRMGFQRITGQSNILAEQTQYLTEAQAQAAAVAHSLDQTHAQLIQTFNIEASALSSLATVYERANKAGLNFAARNPGSMTTPVKGFADGIVSVPGPKGAGDIIPAMLSPGESVIPAKQTAKYGGLIQGIVSDNIPGFRKGVTQIGSQFAHITGRQETTMGQILSDLESLPSDMKQARSELIALVRDIVNTFGSELKAFKFSGLGFSQSEELNNAMKNNKPVSAQEFLNDFKSQGTEKWFGTLKYAGTNATAVGDELARYDKALENAVQNIVSLNSDATITSSQFEAIEKEIRKTLPEFSQLRVALDKAESTMTEFRFNPGMQDAINAGLDPYQVASKKDPTKMSGKRRVILKSGKSFRLGGEHGFVNIPGAFDVEQSIQEIKRGAGVASPSKKTIPIGEDIARGLEVGMQNRQDDVARVANDLGNTAVTGTRKGRRGVSTVGNITPGQPITTVASGAPYVPPVAAPLVIRESTLLKESLNDASDSTVQFTETQNKSSQSFKTYDSKLMKASFGLSALSSAGMMFGGTVGELSQKAFMLSTALFALQQVTQLMTKESFTRILSDRAVIASNAMSAAKFGEGMLKGRKGIAGFLPTIGRVGLGIARFIGPIGFIAGAVTLAGIAFTKYKEKQEAAAESLNALSIAATNSKDALDTYADMFGVVPNQLLSETTNPTVVRQDVRSQIDKIKTNDQFLKNEEKTIKAWKKLSKEELMSAIISKGLDLRARGFAEEQVQAILTALKEKTGRTDVVLDFTKIKFTERALKGFRKSAIGLTNDLNISVGAEIQKQIAELEKTYQTQYAPRRITREDFFGPGGDPLNRIDPNRLGTEVSAKLKTTTDILSQNLNSIATLLQQGVIDIKQYDAALASLDSVISSLNPNVRELATTLMLDKALRKDNEDLADFVKNLGDANQKTLMLQLTSFGLIDQTQAYATAIERRNTAIKIYGENTVAATKAELGLVAVQNQSKNRLKDIKKVYSDLAKAFKDYTDLSEKDGKDKFNLIKYLEAEIKQRYNQVKSLKILAKAKVDAQTAMDIINNPDAAAALATGQNLTKVIEKVNALTAATKMLKLVQDALKPKDEILKDQLEGAKNLLDYEQYVYELQYQKQLDQFELDTTINEYALAQIQEQEDAINKTYDKQIKALDEVQSRQEKINQLQRGRLSLAQALSSGDMAGAAAAIQSIREQEAQDQMDRKRKMLEEKRNRDLANVTFGGTIGRTEFEKRNKEEIETAQKKIDLEKQRIQFLTTVEKLTKTQMGMTRNEIDRALEGLDLAKNAKVDVDSKTFLQNLMAGVLGDAKALNSSVGDAANTFDQYITSVNDVRKNINLSVIELLDLAKQAKDIVNTVNPSTPPASSAPVTGGGSIVVGGTIIPINSPQTKPVIDAKKQEKARREFLRSIGIPGFDSGGKVRGPGTSKSDSIPAMLSNGEYVVNASSVKKYGVDLFEMLNAKKFADGGAAWQERLSMTKKPWSFSSMPILQKENWQSTIGLGKSLTIDAVKSIGQSLGRVLDPTKNYTEDNRPLKTKLLEATGDAFNVGSLGLGPTVAPVASKGLSQIGKVISNAKQDIAFIKDVRGLQKTAKEAKTKNTTIDSIIKQNTKEDDTLNDVMGALLGETKINRNPLLDVLRTKSGYGFQRLPKNVMSPVEEKFAKAQTAMANAGQNPFTNDQLQRVDINQFMSRSLPSLQDATIASMSTKNIVEQVRERVGTIVRSSRDKITDEFGNFTGDANAIQNFQKLISMEASANRLESVSKVLDFFPSVGQNLLGKVLPEPKTVVNAAGKSMPLKSKGGRLLDKNAGRFTLEAEKEALDMELEDLWATLDLDADSLSVAETKSIKNRIATLESRSQLIREKVNKDIFLPQYEKFLGNLPEFKKIEDFKPDLSLPTEGADLNLHSKGAKWMKLKNKQNTPSFWLKALFGPNVRDSNLETISNELFGSKFAGLFKGIEAPKNIVVADKNEMLLYLASQRTGLKDALVDTRETMLPYPPKKQVLNTPLADYFARNPFAHPITGKKTSMPESLDRTSSLVKTSILADILQHSDAHLGNIGFNDATNKFGLFDFESILEILPSKKGITSDVLKRLKEAQSFGKNIVGSKTFQNKDLQGATYDSVKEMFAQLRGLTKDDLAKMLDESNMYVVEDKIKKIFSNTDMLAAQIQKSLPGIGKLKNGGLVNYFANGGYAKGMDRIPAMLSAGEYVVQKKAVDTIGLDNMDRINKGQLPSNSNSVYNYGISVNVNNSNANPNDIARTVINQIKQIDAQRIRSYR